MEEGEGPDNLIAGFESALDRIEKDLREAHEIAMEALRRRAELQWVIHQLLYACQKEEVQSIEALLTKLVDLEAHTLSDDLQKRLDAFARKALEQDLVSLVSLDLRCDVVSLGVGGETPMVQVIQQAYLSGQIEGTVRFIRLIQEHTPFLAGVDPETFYTGLKDTQIDGN